MRENKNQNKNQLVAEHEQPGRRVFWSLLAGVFLVSFSLLAFEITLTRLLSVMLSYHFVFLVVSLALLGLGVGGLFVHLLRRGAHRRTVSLALFTSFFSVSIPLSLIVMTWMADIGFDNLFIYSVLLFIPFFFAGAFLSELFRRLPTFSSRLYGMDLIGAAAGSLGVVLILNSLGGITSGFLLAVTASIAALLMVTATPTQTLKGVAIPIGTFVIVLTLLGINLLGLFVPDMSVGSNPTKEIHHSLYESSLRGQIVTTKWSAFGRTDVVAFRNDPTMMNIYLDGTAGTPMYRFNGDLKAPDSTVEALKTDFPGYLPLSVLLPEEKGNALIIGPGGGRDVLLMLLADVGKITAVEVNKDLVDIVREYASYNGGIYTDLANVSVTVAEGRNFLKRQKEKYDIIMLSLPVTNTSRSVEGFALTENFLFTTESINDYLDHLTDEGRLIVVGHDPVEILRLISLSLTALSGRGIDSEAAMERIYVVGSEMFPVFVMKKTPFEEQEMQSIYQSIHKLGYDETLSYLPTIKQDNMLSPLFIALGKGEVNFGKLIEFFKDSGFDIRPVTDNSPFFYKLEKGIPAPISVVFWSSAIILALSIVVPFLHLQKKSSHRRARDEVRFDRNLLRFLVFFSLLGIGFMLVEISVIQRFILFLGQPVLSLAVLLFSLLIGAGMGSLVSGRVPPQKITRAITLASLSIVGLLLICAFTLPIILNQFLGLELALRLLATVALLVPVGFVMGFPFPLGLRLLKEVRKEDFIPWMWGVNGIGSVVSSALTVLVAITFGFTEALLLGAGFYFVALLTVQGIDKLNREKKPILKPQLRALK